MEIQPGDFDTSAQQRLVEGDIVAQQRANPTAGGKLDGGNPYAEPPYLAGRTYQEGSFANQAYLEGYNQLLDSLRMSKGQAPIPQNIVPEGEG